MKDTAKVGISVAPILAQQQPVGSAQDLLNLLWGGAAVIAAFMTVWALVVAWHALTRDRASGEWKGGLVSALGIMAVPAIIALLAVKFWGIAPPQLNWH